MTATRRTILKGAAATAALTSAPAIVQGQTAPSAARTLKAVMHADLRVFDPIWTTANITSYHGAAVYDTLFGLDGSFQPKPQMVEKFGVSDDKKTWTFELRDGLKFTDGTAVTSADCVASMRRWSVRDGNGQHLFKRVKDTPTKDDKTFQIVLSEPYSLIIDALAKTSPSICYVMRKKEADTDPAQQIKDIVGSGPFIFNKDETKPGARYVYDRNPNYNPRKEPAEATSGAKIVKLDRVIMEHMANEQTALGALQAGEIDVYEVPPQDLIEQLESDPNLTTGILNKTGHLGWLRMNHLHPPFDKPEARRAMMLLVNQADVMKSVFGNRQGAWQPCWGFFGCGTPMDSTANTEWLSKGPDLAKAKELFKQAGYDGRPVVVLHPSDHYLGNPASQLIVQWLKQAGVNAELASSDWGGVVTRRANKNAPDQGGWNLFITWADGNSVASPIALAGHAAVGDKGWFGWPSDETHEKLRDKWALAPTLEDKQKVAREIQENAWNFVPHVWLGQWMQPTARRANVKGFLYCPGVIPFWNVEKA